MRPKTFTSYALLGSGRMARHLDYYLTSLGLPFFKWSRRDFNAEQNLSEILSKSSHILLAIKDEALASMARRARPHQTVVHFSGALSIPDAFNAHPLMTFGEQLEALEWYRNIPFIVDEDVDFSAILPGLPNPHWGLSPEKRHFYHALCSLAGNSTFMLWKMIGDEFENSLHLPRTLLSPFLHQVVTNSSRARKADFTGPVARGDWEVVRSHMQSLDHDPALQSAYKSYLKLVSDAGLNIPEGIA